MALFSIIITISILYLGGLFVNRLFLSPISRFPGPSIAALTFWYEFYYDVVKKGKYTWKIQELHQRYGPIVRINPHEVHINDPTFYESIYTGPSRKTNKWPWSAKMFGTSLAAVGTPVHELHRLRRSALNPFFSKRTVSKLEPGIQKIVDQQSERLKGLANTGKPVNLLHVFSCLSADIISGFAFGWSYNHLASEDFNPGWHHFMMELSKNTHLMKQFGWVYDIMTCLPERFVALLHPLTRQLFSLKTDISQRIQTILCQFDSSSHRDGQGSDSPTIFHDLLNGSLPTKELTIHRLTDEALTLVGAGTVTTAYTLATVVYYTLSDREIRETLQRELAEAYSVAKHGHSDFKLSWQTLEHLPYLTAIINEGLRLSFGVSHRLQRVAPDMPLVYQGWIIPPGVPVSMTQMFIHQDPNLFPSPKSFLPDRWLVASASSEQQSHRRRCFAELPDPSDARHHLHPFSRGTRACVGQNLAYAELYLALAALFAPVEKGGFHMELFETDETDIEIQHDYFNPAPREDSKGIRVLIKMPVESKGDDV